MEVVLDSAVVLLWLASVSAVRKGVVVLFFHRSTGRSLIRSMKTSISPSTIFIVEITINRRQTEFLNVIMTDTHVVIL